MRTRQNIKNIPAFFWLHSTMNIKRDWVQQASSWTSSSKPIFFLISTFISLVKISLHPQNICVNACWHPHQGVRGISTYTNTSKSVVLLLLSYLVNDNPILRTAWAKSQTIYWHLPLKQSLYYQFYFINNLFILFSYLSSYYQYFYPKHDTSYYQYVYPKHDILSTLVTF